MNIYECDFCNDPCILQVGENTKVKPEFCPYDVTSRANWAILIKSALRDIKKGVPLSGGK